MLSLGTKCLAACSFCFPHDTSVLLASGEEAPIQALGVRRTRRLLFRGGGRFEPNQATQAHVRAYEGELVEIEMEDGTFLACTPNHSIMTQRGWGKGGRPHGGRPGAHRQVLELSSCERAKVSVLRRRHVGASQGREVLRRTGVRRPSQARLLQRTRSKITCKYCKAVFEGRGKQVCCASCLETCVDNDRRRPTSRDLLCPHCGVKTGERLGYVNGRQASSKSGKVCQVCHQKALDGMAARMRLENPSYEAPLDEDAYEARLIAKAETAAVWARGAEARAKPCANEC